jgi:xylulokinase
MATVGVDLGTGSVKVAVVDDDVLLQQQAEATYRVDSPKPGWAESDPEDWRVAVQGCLSEIAGTHGLRAVGLCGQMHGVVFTDEHFRPLRPAILWADTRSTAEAKSMAESFPPEKLAELGSAAVPGFAATSVAWVARHEPQILAQTRYVLQPKDWLRVTLGGELATDPSDASGTLLANVASGHWDPQAVAWSGLVPEQLPPISPSDGSAGDIVIGKQNLPITVGAADTAAVLLSSGLGIGEGFLAIGTGAQVVRVLDAPTLDPTLRTHTFARAGEPGHGWYRIGAVQNAGLALQVVLRWLNSDIAEAHDALETDPNPNDPIFLPFLAGERTPFMNPNLRGSWVNLGLNTDRKAMLRSVLVGLAQAVAFAVEAVFPDDKTKPLFLTGGGSRDDRFRSLLANATGHELIPVATPAQGVVGAALLAMDREPSRPEVRPSVGPGPTQVDFLREQRETMRHLI